MYCTHPSCCYTDTLSSFLLGSEVHQRIPPHSWNITQLLIWVLCDCGQRAYKHLGNTNSEWGLQSFLKSTFKGENRRILRWTAQPKWANKFSASIGIFAGYSTLKFNTIKWKPHKFKPLLPPALAILHTDKKHFDWVDHESGLWLCSETIHSMSTRMTCNTRVSMLWSLKRWYKSSAISCTYTDQEFTTNCFLTFHKCHPDIPQNN